MEDTHFTCHHFDLPLVCLILPIDTEATASAFFVLYHGQDVDMNENTNLRLKVFWLAVSCFKMIANKRWTQWL